MSFTAIFLDCQTSGIPSLSALKPWLNSRQTWPKRTQDLEIASRTLCWALSPGLQLPLLTSAGLFLRYRNRTQEHHQHPTNPASQQFPVSASNTALCPLESQAPRNYTLHLLLLPTSHLPPSSKPCRVCSVNISWIYSSPSSLLPFQFKLVITQLSSNEGFLTSLFIFAIFILYFFIGRSLIYYSSFGFLKQLYWNIMYVP